jgi:hypothetical protein
MGGEGEDRSRFAEGMTERKERAGVDLPPVAKDDNPVVDPHLRSEMWGTRFSGGGGWARRGGERGLGR